MQIITLKRKTGLSASMQSTSQSSIPRVPSSKNVKQLNTVENSSPKSSNAISTNLLEKDIVELHNSVASKSKISNKNESIISKQFDVAASQESMSDVVISNNNDVDNVDTEDTSSIMNIKITNVTSLPPELFESVPDVALHENSIDTSSPSTSKSLEKLVAYIAPSKRVYEEGNFRNKHKFTYHHCTYNFDNILYYIFSS